MNAILNGHSSRSFKLNTIYSDTLRWTCVFTNISAFKLFSSVHSILHIGPVHFPPTPNSSIPPSACRIPASLNARLYSLITLKPRFRTIMDVKQRQFWSVYRLVTAWKHKVLYTWMRVCCTV